MAHINRLRIASIVGAVAVCATMLPACEDFQEFEQYRARRDAITPYVGDSVRHNMAVQTIDPWPHYARNNEIGLDGHRAVIAAERYRANRVITPRGLSTSNAGGGAGAGAPAAAK